MILRQQHHSRLPQAVRSFRFCCAMLLALLFTLPAAAQAPTHARSRTSHSAGAGSVIQLSPVQKEALVLAYRAGDHYGIGLLFAAVVWEESKLCKFTVGDHGKAHGCAQLHESAVKAVTGVTLASWELTDPNTQELNLAIGARYLDLCLQDFGYPAGIGCFNRGMTRAAKLGRKRLSRLPYTKAVLANMKMLEQLPQSED